LAFQGDLTSVYAEDPAGHYYPTFIPPSSAIINVQSDSVTPGPNRWYLGLAPVDQQGFHLSDGFVTEIDFSAIELTESLPFSELPGYLEKNYPGGFTLAFISTDPADLRGDMVVRLYDTPFEKVLYAELASETSSNLLHWTASPAEAVVAFVPVVVLTYVTVAITAMTLAAALTLIPPMMEGLANTFEQYAKGKHLKDAAELGEHLKREFEEQETEPDSAPAKAGSSSELDAPPSGPDPCETSGGSFVSVEQETAACATEIIMAIKNQDMKRLAERVHPDKGVRFSPYTFVDSQHLVFSADQLPDLLADPAVHTWGAFDGTGEPIQFTFRQYYDRFIYDADFAHADMVGYDETIGWGNTINNIAEFYPEAVAIEYHFPGFDPQYEGMDWRSLRLVLEEKDGRLYLVAIVHDEWTI
jgi:hypothetical protein